MDKPERKINIGSLYPLLMAMSRGMTTPRSNRVSLPTPEKKCVNCKAPHTTGKPFCSADCCREYKANGNQGRVIA